MTQYGLGQDYTLALDLLSGSTTSLMTPRQNMLCTPAAKVINGRLVLRLQQWTFHQRDWNLTLSSACKEECVARHESYFWEVRERRANSNNRAVRLRLAETSRGCGEVDFQIYRRLDKGAKKMCHDLDQCWRNW